LQFLALAGVGMINLLLFLIVGVYFWVRDAINLHSDLMPRNDWARSESSPRRPCVPAGAR
jgi:hypothetical protein